MKRSWAGWKIRCRKTDSCWVFSKVLYRGWIKLRLIMISRMCLNLTATVTMRKMSSVHSAAQEVSLNKKGQNGLHPNLNTGISKTCSKSRQFPSKITQLTLTKILASEKVCEMRQFLKNNFTNWYIIIIYRIHVIIL